jgi:type III restriction enzyme
MKIDLFEFQDTALAQLREKIVIARRHSSSDQPQAIAFSAPTGSGKTIVMTALFEDILFGAAGFPAQPDAVILWVSDMPELNEQTRSKIEGKSDRIRVRHLVNIDGTFDSERLEGGHVYFINTQKLGTDKLLTKAGDGRKYSVWTTLSNTARAAPDRFYVVIDEAHRGMTAGRSALEAQTLMQRFLLGFPEVGLVRMPLVIGVSATPKRFLDLLEHADHMLQSVAIPADAVRISGLLKDRILIHHPERATVAAMSLLEEAARKWGKLTTLWGDYCKAENESRVWPILVIQIENGNEKLVTKTDLLAVMDVIEKAIERRLNEGEIAHAMHDAGDMDIGGRLLRRVDASRINDNREIGVVVFKTSLSTGWDCPRAEVMMSFRRAEDHTYIAQLLGRMVRTPLARRIERDAELNDVHLFVPSFDAKAVDAVVRDLQNVEEIPPAETGSSRELVILQRRQAMDDVFDALNGLVTYKVNNGRAQSNVRRLLGMARGLTVDGIAPTAWDTARSSIVGWMNHEVKTIRSSSAYADSIASISRLALRTMTVEHGIVQAVASEGYTVDVSDVDIETVFEEAGRSLGNGLHMAYWQENADESPIKAKVELVALSRSHTSMTAIETKAEAAFNRLFDLHKREIGKLREQRRQHYEKLRTSAAVPVEVLWLLPDSIDFRRTVTALTYEKHLFVEEDGTFRSDLGPWERDVIGEELARPDAVGWLRNVDRKPWSMEIPYRTGRDVRPMFPDLVMVRRGKKEALIVDILEPHDPSLADNFEKAVGLAEFAERHGHLFGRIQLIRKLPSPAGVDRFARLDVNVRAVQQKVKLITSNPQLDDLFVREAV